MAYLAKQKEVEERNRLMLQRQYWDACGAPTRHMLPTIDRCEEEWLKARRKARAVCADGGIIALIGGRGTGKTQMGVDIIRDYCKQVKRALYVRAASFFMAVRECYRKDAVAKEADVLNQLVRPHLLVIDEMNERAETPAEQRLLALVIDRRYGELKPTILIGNLSENPEDANSLRRNVGESIYDRLIETGGFITCDWPSFRTEGGQAGE